MSVLQANCPSCAGPIEFKAGSTIVLVCPFCRSAVARTDRGARGPRQGRRDRRIRITAKAWPERQLTRTRDLS